MKDMTTIEIFDSLSDHDKQIIARQNRFKNVESVRKLLDRPN